MSAPRVSVLLAVALGGAIGALARFGVSLMWPNGSDAYLIWRTGEAAFPWTTMLINAVGCLLMGVLVVTLKERFLAAPSLLNPFLGTGVLGASRPFPRIPTTRGACLRATSLASPSLISR